MRKTAEEQIASYSDAYVPIIYAHHFDFKMIDQLIGKVGEGVFIMEFDNALGEIDFTTKSALSDKSLSEFLKLVLHESYERPTYTVLKDVHHYLGDPQIIALLKRIAENHMYRDEFQSTIFIVSTQLIIPAELEEYISILDIPLPSRQEIQQLLTTFTQVMEIDVPEEELDAIAVHLKGLSEFKINQILNLAYQNGGTIDISDKDLILKEKEQFIKKSGMLELINLRKGLDDIGGLIDLKTWLSKKAELYKNLDKAIKFGADVPKGYLTIGMPGCGKSLIAKATANLFEVPLVRLDIGRLLGKYVGESEKNMRQALKMAEAISPCVLWIDELEKAFAGVNSDSGGSDVTTRLFGHFLTWMQEKENTVFVVATANDISKLPLEFLRKGRFDELFFVDLPNEEERKHILEIHIKNRQKWNREINTIALAQQTEGFNGSDLESVVKEAIETLFIDSLEQKRDLPLTTELLLQSIKETKSISETFGEVKIAEMRKKITVFDVKQASCA